MEKKDWDFVHARAAEAQWKPGMRKIFDYRDLGIQDATKGAYIAHIIKANGKKAESSVQTWHLHDCEFQIVLVLKGWAKFEYEGQGVHKIEAGDCILQPPLIKHREIECSADFEVLEIVAPGDFATREVGEPAAA